MDNRPIGVFDSGLGGLTCIPNLFGDLPEERVIYFGDTARTPYGSKAISTVKAYTNQIADFLASKDVKMMVIACNTISATCLTDLRERYPNVPIVGIIEPIANKIIREETEEIEIGVIATKATVASGVYEKLIRSGNDKVKLFSGVLEAYDEEKIRLVNGKITREIERKNIALARYVVHF